MDTTNRSKIMQQVVQTLENVVAKVFKSMPHLPENGRKWLADNVWWIALIGAIIGAIGLLLAIGSIFQTASFINAVNYYAYSYLPTYRLGGGAMAGMIISAIATAVSAGLLAAAVKPLQNKSANGWRLLFVAALLSSILYIVGGLLTNFIDDFIVSLILTVIVLFVALYFIFEVRSYFISAKKTAAKKTKS